MYEPQPDDNELMKVKVLGPFMRAPLNSIQTVTKRKGRAAVALGYAEEVHTSFPAGPPVKLNKAKKATTDKPDSDTADAIEAVTISVAAVVTEVESEENA